MDAWLCRSSCDHEKFTAGSADRQSELTSGMARATFVRANRAAIRRKQVAENSGLPKSRCHSRFSFPSKICVVRDDNGAG